jgi:hypothetical protein
MRANIAAAFRWGSILGVLFATAPAIHGNAVPSFSLPELAKRSDLIAIARVETVAKIGEGIVSVNGTALQADLMEATVHPSLVLKGEANASIFKIEFALPFSPGGSLGYGTLPNHQNRLLFLNKISVGHFAFTDPYYPSLPATGSKSEEGREPTQSRASARDVEMEVVAVECGAIGSQSSKSSERIEAIWALQKRTDPCIEDALLIAFSSPEPELRLTAAAALLRRNDIRVLSAAFQETNHLPMRSYLRLNVASAIRDGVRSESAIPDLQIILSNEDPRMRRAAASALRNIGSRACISGLAKALNDTDKDTLYYAVVGLAEIEGQQDKKPSMEDFDTNPRPYLDYWRAWSKQHSKLQR